MLASNFKDWLKKMGDFVSGFEYIALQYNHYFNQCPFKKRYKQFTTCVNTTRKLKLFSPYRTHNAKLLVKHFANFC
jgi:hypothetical protein